MKKFTLLIALLAFSVGFGQTTPVEGSIKQDRESPKLEKSNQKISPARNSNSTPATYDPANQIVLNSLKSLIAPNPNEIQDELDAEANSLGSIPANRTGTTTGTPRASSLADIIPNAGATETFAVVTGDFFYDPTDGVTGGVGGDCTTTSSGDPGDYPNCGCVTTTTLTGTDLEVEFLSFRVFGTFDFLNIYDGPDTASPQIYDSNLNADTDTLAGMITANGSAVFTSTTGALTFEFSATAVVNTCGWEVEVLNSGGGGGGGACPAPMLEVNQDITDTCMANISQTDLAQSYVAVEAISAGAGVEFQSVSTGLDVTLSLWDALPNAGGTMLASGTSQTDGVNLFTDVFWDPVVNVTPGDTYYIVIDGDTALPCVSGSTNDPYPGGNVFANAGYQSFPAFDYTFRTYSCDGGGGTCTPESLTTTFAGGNGNFGNMFDINALTDINIDSFDVNADTGATFDVEVYAKLGTYEGFETDPSAWTLIGTAPGVVSNGDGVATPLNLMLGYAMAAGETHAFYVTPTDFSTGGFNYTNGTTVGNVFASDANIEFLEGAGSGYPFNGTLFSPRVWNGNIVYCVDTGGGATNDECAGATPVACDDVVVGTTADNTDTGGNAAPDEWYSFTGSGSPQVVTVSLCDGGTDYDSFLRVFDACGGAEIATNDDSCGLQSELSFLSDGTSTYYIMVEGFSSNSGNFSLAITCVDPPVNDECAGALPIACGETVVGNTDDATIDSSPVCNTSITAPGVWYEFTDDSGLVSDYVVSLCDGGTDYDSKLTIYSGDCGALVCVGDNDDTCGLQSEVAFQGDGNTTYYILVHGFGANTGNFSLNVSCTPVPPPNDLIVNSIDVDEIGFPYTDPAVAMPAATTEGGNPTGCNIDGANGVWYNFIPVGDGFATATVVSPAGATFVNFFSAPDENATEDDLTLVDFNGNQCAPQTDAIIPTTAGQAYYVFVVNTGGITDIVIDGEALGTDDNTIKGFTYYPNPAADVLNLNSIESIDNVAIYNILGQRVLNQDINATSAQLDMAQLAQGAYVMKVSVNGEIGTYKIIKR